jgi:AcrR family transcriptional regulator
MALRARAASGGLPSAGTLTGACESDGLDRVSTQEGRESVIRAAIPEFALTGYYGTSTAAIAKRVGATQP